MRPLPDIQKRWSLLSDDSIGVDFRTSVRDGDTVDPCEAGLRSVCWKSFLLYGPISLSTWPKKLSESRSAYSSLRDHFLRFIDNPNDIHSATDPLADDDTSPWSTLRQDEEARAEIFQDVTRTHQDNFYFKEPETQKKLLDILFIYSKLNPDTGYRQGMHELLAPLLWVVNQDAIDENAILPSDKAKDGADLMIETLNKKWIEADAFSLFCAVMQNAKSSYETGDNKDCSPIIARSRRINDELLSIFDSELALHLQVIGILPQIYAIRWVRLLFGREFQFKDVLRIWDLLFAEDVQSSIVDLTCVAFLLRMRWDLVEADYSNAITRITRPNIPSGDHDPRSLVRDAIYLQRNKSSEAGAELIQRTSGRRPKVQRREGAEHDRPPAHHISARGLRTPQNRNSASPSPARFASPQKQLETIFSNVSGGLQQRTEGWNVSKAVRSAVGEVKKNMNNFQAHTRGPSADILGYEPPRPHQQDERMKHEVRASQQRLQEVTARNKALSKMLDGALDDLRSNNVTNSESKEARDESFNLSLAKIQFVSVYLADPEIPIPAPDPTQHDLIEPADKMQVSQKPAAGGNGKTKDPERNSVGTLEPSQPSTDHAAKSSTPSPASKPTTPASLPVRPSLANSSFSFMLGENRHRSSFVSSVADLPEQRRDSHSNETEAKPKQLLADQKKTKTKERRGSKDDGFTMSSMRASQPAVE